MPSVSIRLRFRSGTLVGAAEDRGVSDLLAEMRCDVSAALACNTGRWWRDNGTFTSSLLPSGRVSPADSVARRDSWRAHVALHSACTRYVEVTGIESPRRENKHAHRRSRSDQTRSSNVGCRDIVTGCRSTNKGVCGCQAPRERGTKLASIAAEDVDTQRRMHRTLLVLAIVLSVRHSSGCARTRTRGQ